MSDAAQFWYERLARQLLPPGKLWPRGEYPSNFAALFELWAEFLLEVDQRIELAATEANPLTTQAMLTEWEGSVGLPGSCTPIAETLIARRAAVIGRVTAPPGSTPTDLVELAAAAGYSVTIEEHTITDCELGTCVSPVNGTVGDQFSPAAPDAWAYAYTVHAPSYTVFWWGPGCLVGEPLASWDNSEVLECIMREAKPAHTYVLFAYDLSFVGFAPWTDAVPPPASAAAWTPPTPTAIV